MAGYPCDAPKEKWTLRGSIEVSCFYIFYGLKKKKTELRNK